MPEIENSESEVLRTQPKRLRRALAISALAMSATLSLVACSRSEPRAPVHSQSESPQARIVERSAAALHRMQDSPRFSAMSTYLAGARAVMIFPRVVKASLIVGGEGGNGVMVVRKPNGAWSEPAFYSLGAPSIGLQVGYQEATVILFIMDDATLERAYRSSFTLGTQAGAALGDVVEPVGGSAGSVVSPRVYQAVESDGVYAGVSLDGYVIDARDKHNVAYYGPEATPRTILIEGSMHRPENAVLAEVLGRAPHP